MSPDPKVDEHGEPAPVMAGKNGAADSAGTRRAQGEFTFDGEETGNAAGDGEAAAPADGTSDAPEVKESDPLPGREAHAKAGFAKNEEAAPGSEETETVQSKGRPKPGWTNI